MRVTSDSESERLLSDTGSGISDISVIPVSFVNLDNSSISVEFN